MIDCCPSIMKCGFEAYHSENMLFPHQHYKRIQVSSQDGTGKRTLQRSDQTRKRNPVAVVGISCRFAEGVDSKDAFWQMLIQGGCVIGSYPRNRLGERDMKRFFNPARQAAGKHYTLKGAFLDRISGFDAQFFGISPAECRALDPQQRLLLQVVYEAIEDAGIRLEDLQECRTGVYVGLMNLDYARLLLDDSNVPRIDEFASTGMTASTVANRVSYLFNFTGPSLTVDTACSSSLTALNIAVTHLQQTECDVAIVCAPNLILARYFHTAFCRTGLLAQDGRCKCFDIKGDGYGRGEGIAAVILKPTVTALRDHDDPYAQIVACGLNNDGQNAIPMTSPSDKMQTELAQRVLNESGLTKDDIQYVEAHGTGTAVGDPVEVRSVSSVYGNSSNRILRIGSVKSNINHTESTAGLAGLIKVCLMIKNSYFVPTVNVHKLKPQLMMPEGKMAVQMKLEPWLRNNEKPRTAAVCCYGYGGANAHAIVQEVSQSRKPEVNVENRACWVMTFSARSRDALKMLAKRFSNWIDQQPEVFELLKKDICYTLNNRRTLHTHRLAVTFRTLKQAATLTKMFGEEKSGYQNFVAVGESSVVVKKLAFIYGGQGTRWHGMASELIQNEPKFRESIEKIDVVLDNLGVQWSLIEELRKSEKFSRVHENIIGQTALFALHYSMTELLKFWGITPSAVLGHSLGEISAACVAHALTLKEALELVLLRSQLHESCSTTGCMAAISLSADQADQLVTSLFLKDRVCVAVRNSPEDVVLSGDTDSVRAIETYVHQHHPDVFWKRLATTRAYHSNQMEAIKERFLNGVERIKLTRNHHVTIPFYSTVTGTQVTRLTHGHWWNNVRHAVLFNSAVENIVADGYKTFVEVNASPQFPRHVQNIVKHYHRTRSTEGSKVSVIATLPKKSEDEQYRTFLKNCPGGLFACGYPIAWDKIQGTGSRRFVRCPTYPWQEKDYWYRENEPEEHVKLLSSNQPEIEVPAQPLLPNRVPMQPLLGMSVPAEPFIGLHVWESEIDLYRLPYLKDHAFQDSDSSVIPGAIYVETALAMILHTYSNVTPRLKAVKFKNLITLSENDVLKLRTRLQMKLGAEKENSYQMTMIEENGSEVLVSEGLAVFEAAEERNYKAEPLNPENITTIISRLKKQSLEVFNRERVKRRFCYGPQFSIITETWSANHEALCIITLTEEIRCAKTSYVLHPSIIDACFQSRFLLSQHMENPVPYRIDDVTLLRRNVTEHMYCHVMSKHNDPSCNIVLMDCYGNAVLLIKGFLMIDMSSLRGNLVLNDVAYDVTWEQEAIGCPATEEKYWLILPDLTGFAKRFVSLLPKNNSSVLLEFSAKPREIQAKFRRDLEQAMTKVQAQEARKICVVNFFPVDNNSLSPEWENFQQSHQLAFESSLVVLQVILEMEEFAKHIQLVLICCESTFLKDTKANDPPIFPWSSTLFGFRRTLDEELPDLETTIVDLPSHPSSNDFKLMVTDLCATKIPEEVMYRNDQRYLNKIERLHTGVETTTNVLPCFYPTGEPRSFEVSTISGRTQLKETERKEPKRGFSEIQVSNACPILQTSLSAVDDRVLACGRLTKSSSQCFCVGDLGIFVCEMSRLGNYMIVEDEKIVKLDEKLTAEEAACLCFPMALSFHVMSEIAHSCAGKRLMVYADQEMYTCVFACVASAFGAIVVCITKTTQCGARVQHIGTSVAITEDELLMKQNIENVSSDMVVFFNFPRERILKEIMYNVRDGGKVVAISRSELERFEIRIPVTKNIVFLSTDLDEITESVLGGFVTRSTALLARTGYLKWLKSIPRLSKSVYDNVESLLVSMFGQESCLVCSINFTTQDKTKKAVFNSSALDLMCLREDRTYLVVGGVRGFGFEVARWLVENGAKIVMCTARSPPDEDKIAEVARLMEMTGSRIILRQADVTSWEDMTSVMAELDSLPEVAGIVFTAMVLEDQFIKDADLETCARVVGTKVQGSAVLHQLSLTMNLDFFIMFSSIAGVVGNVGQLAYSAANTFLDSLCSYRKYKLGLPALSVDWGTMSGAGILERAKGIANLFQNYGFRLMSCTEGMSLLNQFLHQFPHQAQVILCDIDWDVFLKNSGYALHRSPRLQSIKNETMSYNADKQHDSHVTLDGLHCQVPEQRRETVEMFVRNLLSSWSESCPSEVDLNLAFYKYGVDSIGAANMSLQMRNWIGVLFETYYFIQPKANGATLIKDTLKQIEDLAKNNTNTEEQVKFTYEEGVNYGTPSYENNRNGAHVEAPENSVKLVPLHVPDDAVISVFMIHSSHKSALANAPFAAGFQKQDSVSLYSIGVNEELFATNKYGSVKELAKRYITLIREKQRHGPYYFAGFSFGGVLSYEIASQLIAEDEVVAMVVMLDTFPWYPETLVDEKQLRQIQEIWIKYFKEKTARRYLNSVAVGRLGFSSEEFQKLADHLGAGESLLLALEKRAKQRNVLLKNLREQAASLTYQAEESSLSYYHWKPSKTLHPKTLTYIVCRNSLHIQSHPTLWNGPDCWKTLTDEMDLLSIPAGHFDLLDQPNAEICGSFIMSTALIKHHSNYTIHCRQGPRSRRKELCIGWLKGTIDISIYSNDVALKCIPGQLSLNDKETALKFTPSTFASDSKIIRLSDVHNVVPGTYVDTLNSLLEQDKELIVTLLLGKNTFHHLLCVDWKQRDRLIETFEVVFKTALLKF